MGFFKNTSCKNAVYFYLCDEDFKVLICLQILNDILLTKDYYISRRDKK